MTLEINPHSGKCPPGRKWIYKEDDFTFSDENPDVVAARVGKYRLEHGKPLRDPLHDVLAYVGEKYPYLVRRVDGSGALIISEKQEISEKVNRFMLAQTAPIKSCEIELIAGVRKRICSECPMHTEVSFDTKDESDRYEKLIAKYTYGKSVKHPDIGVCKAYYRDCREMIYQSTESLPENTQEGCWIGKDLSEFID